ncbi:FxsA family protein [Emcibacter sp. SYSU 3D8]|uniref:FxsA family protein n=1 Tax=Emcibacter sp. SYSU 3D8 TaxID=3133969 RepID=UPI0031FEDD0F
MLIALVLIFVAIPALEIYLFVQVGDLIGAGPTVALAFLAVAVGMAVIRMQTPRAIGRAQESLRRGEAPVTDVLDGIALIGAGGLLILPGFFTDVLGLLLLVPWVRRSLGYAVLHRALKPAQARAAAAGVVDGEFVVMDTSRSPDPSSNQPRLPPAP